MSSAAVYLVEFSQEFRFEALREALIKETHRAIKELASDEDFVQETGYLHELYQELLRATSMDRLKGIGGNSFDKTQGVWFVRTSRYASIDILDATSAVIYAGLKSSPGVRLSLVTKIFDRKPSWKE